MHSVLLACLAAVLALPVPEEATPLPLAPGTWVGRSAIGDRVAFAMLNVPAVDSPVVLALPLERRAHPLALSLRDEFRVPCAKHLTHPARADGGDDFIRSEPRS